MMTMKATKKTTTTVEMVPVQIRTGKAEFYLLGRTAFIFNAMSMKSKASLLWPSGRMTTAEKATSLKHNPPQEYRDSVYARRVGEVGPTRLQIPTTMPKAAVAQVAKRVPGSTTAEIQQMLWMEGSMVDLYGVPQIFMSVVRSAGIDRVPDIRTRAIVPEWCCRIIVQYVQPQLTFDAITRLLYAAGVMNGLGDFRQQKGAGNYGQFEVVAHDDPRIKSLMKNGGMKAQDDALKNPIPYDLETERMLEFFNEKMATSEHRKRDEGSTDTVALKMPRRKGRNNGVIHHDA
jgi:hypothetical protein